MTTLLIIRHGQSMGNLEDRFIGQTDSPLSELGMLQAEKTAEYVASTYTVDKIYSSDLSRAYDTGRKLSEKTGLEITTDKNLREIYAGEWETLPFTEIIEKYPEEFKIWMEDVGRSTCVGGESIVSVYRRATEAIEKIAKENDGKVVAITTHATVIRSVLCYFKGIPAEDMKDSKTWVSNASVTKVTYENGTFTIESESYDKHLEGFITKLPEDV